MHLLRKKSERGDNKNSIINSNWSYHLLALAIPALVMLGAFVVLKVFPFGERAVMIVDSYHQYVPFFSELHNKIWSGDSLLYSWHGSLGFNFWAVQAYYLASPLNLLIAIFPSSLMIEAFECLIVLKICISSWSMFWYLSAKNGRKSYGAVVFGYAYALGGFTIAYNWNVMWLDCLALFPLVVLGIERFINERDWRLYTIMMGLTIFCNYYMAIMVCIFVVLYYFVVWFSKKRSGIKEFFGRGIRFAGCSLLAGGLAGIYLLPTYYVMINSSQGSSPKAVEVYRDFFLLLRQQFALTVPTKLSGAPNIYCGVLVGMLIFFYMGAKNIGIREKIGKILLTVFLLVSMNLNVLDYIWHGFHFPNNLPARFSFIYIFMMVAMAYEGWRTFEKTEGKVCILFFVMEAIWFVMCNYAPSDEPDFLPMVVTGILFCIYMVLMMCEQRHYYLKIPKGKQGEKGVWKIHPKQICLLILMAELAANAIYGLGENGTINRTTYTSDQAEVAQIRETYADAESFYRIELAQMRGRDDVTWHNLNGLSFFSSTADDRMEKLMGALGFYDAGNKYSYKGATPLTDALFAIRYVISSSEMWADNLVLADQTENKYVYENTQCLSIGYVVNADIADWKIVEGDPFATQNDFVWQATDIDDALFTQLKIDTPELNNAELSRTAEDTYYYRKSSSKGTMTWELTFDEETDVYIYFEASHCNNLKVTIDGKTTTYSDEKGHIVHLGLCDATTEVKLVFNMNDSYSSGNVKLQVFAYNEAVFDEVYAQLSESQWQVTNYDSTSLSGSIDVAEDGILMLSIPYDEGWTLWVDGEETEMIAIGEALMGCALTEGIHTLEMRYSPQGFKMGLALTAGSLLVLVLCFWVRQHRRRRLKKAS